MKADIFTKTVLTVIAVNLTILTVKDLDIIPKAYAMESTNTPTLLPNINYGLVPLNEDGTIDVNIKSFNSSAVMDVNIAATNGYRMFYDTNGDGEYYRIPVSN